MHQVQNQVQSQVQNQVQTQVRFYGMQQKRNILVYFPFPDRKMTTCLERVCTCLLCGGLSPWATMTQPLLIDPLYLKISIDSEKS